VEAQSSGHIRDVEPQRALRPELSEGVERLRMVLRVLPHNATNDAGNA